MTDWGVWCRRGEDPTFGWFQDSNGMPICYHSEAEACRVARDLQALLPQNAYEAQPMLETCS